MSKGPGRVQRAIVDLFVADPEEMPDSIEITCRVFAVSECDPAQHVSVRRALRSLAKRGEIVDMGRAWHNGRRRWALPAQATAYHELVERTFGRRQ